ncbi:MAG: SPFH domain-containing protein [Cyanobacteriota bacterium]|nr:SPFH domain-containing protein [Cyanobacteriota bacterium]
MTSVFSLLLLVGGLAAVTGVRSWYAVCQPNQVLVIYGWRSRRQRGEERLIGYRLLKGGSSFVFPLVEEVEAMDVGNLIIPLTVPNALTRGGIRISVEAVANVKVASREPAIHAAVERLLGKTIEEIKALAQVTLESNLRGVLATLTPEQVNADREAFAVAMLAEAEDDLRQLGLDLDSLQITAITDDARFLDSLGRPQQVELLRQSRIAEAEAQALARIQEAEQGKVTELVRLRRDEAIARVEAERRIRDAVSRETALVAEAEAQIAGERARVEAELPMQAERIAMVTNQLQADVVAPAEAECARAVALAKGGAAAILEEGAARAEGLNALVASWRQAGPDARAVYLTQRLPTLLPLLRGAVPALKVKELRLIGEGANPSPSLPTLLAQVQSATGFDAARWLGERGTARPGETGTRSGGVGETAS